MNNLYIFAIGGSGQRVMHSFMMLLAGGMKLNIAGKVTPVFIDTDINSHALKECIELIGQYREIHENLCNSIYCENGASAIDSIHEKMFTQVVDGPVQLVTAGNKTLAKLIDNGGEELLSDDGKAELANLYSDEMLNMPLDYGFVGVPAIGSVALNYLLNTTGADNLIDSIQPGDGIFIIGSIFGGTGAAGLPLLLNKISLSKGANINQFYIGALSILPYFKFDDVNADTPPTPMEDYFKLFDANSFDAKTKAALYYYNTHIKNVSSLYYLGLPDAYRSKIKKAIGGVQANQEPDYFETVAARSLFDFSNTAAFVNAAGPSYHVYNLKDTLRPKGAAQIYDLKDIPDVKVQHSLIRLQMFRYIYLICVKNYLNNPKLGFTISSCFKEGDYAIVKEWVQPFFVKYQTWLNGLANGNHGLPLKYAQDGFNDAPEKDITSYFIPNISKTVTKGFLSKCTEIEDPMILNNMTKAIGMLTTAVASNGRDKYQAVIYTVEYAIEKVINEKII